MLNEKEQYEKTMKIVEAVDDLGGNLTIENSMFYDSGEDVVAVSNGSYLALKSQGPIFWEVICTVEEFNQCVKEMSDIAGHKKFVEYAISEKQVLTKEDCILYRLKLATDKVSKCAKISSNAANEGHGKWKNGDECVYSHRKDAILIYIGEHPNKQGHVVDCPKNGLTYIADGYLTRPETQEQKAAKEREAKIAEFDAWIMKTNARKISEFLFDSGVKLPD